MRYARAMSKVKVMAFTVSIDGYGAGPRQSLQAPLGEGGDQLHKWFVPTRTFQTMVLGKSGEGTTDEDDAFARASFDNVGAWILGRNMFAPSRGPWPDDGWQGWWGDTPPYHVPTFILTHHPRESITMKGGTVFHFVTGGIHEALERAREAAAGKDVRIGGGVSTVRQYLQAGLIDAMHLAQSPVLLGSGEALLAGLDLNQLGYRCTRHQGTANAQHVVLERKA
jgi:dihydrofolate reductase